MVLAHTYKKIRSKKTNKKQFKILEKDKYVTPDQIFEGFVGIADDLTPPTYWTFEDVDIQMLHDNTCPLLCVIISLTIQSSVAIM